MPSESDEFLPLLPAGLHSMSLRDIERLCVDDVRFTHSSTRSSLFRAISDVVFECDQLEIPGSVWINGSFLTEKLDPADADLCLRIRNEVYDYGSREQVACIDWITSSALYLSQRVDGYLLVEYPFNHANFAIGVENLSYWKKQFGKSRLGVEKGIAVVELTGRST